MQGDREKILNSGFDGYLSKPVNSGSLAQELERVLALPHAQNVTSPQPCEKQIGRGVARAIAKQAAKP
jgi:hypothetical protein